MDDIYSLIMEGDAPTAQQKAAEMARALRRQQTTGQLMQMHPLLRQMGQGVMESSGQGLGQLAQVGQAHYGAGQQKLRQDSQQSFTAGESQKDRDFQGRQNALNRALQREKANATKTLDFSDKSSLRKEFNALPEVKAFKEVDAAYGKIQSAAKNPSPAGDLSLIFGYMKILDPGSTVREGEFANAQNAAGVPTQVMNMYNRALSGQRLAPEQRQDFVSQAGHLYGVHKSKYDGQAKLYETLATRAGVDPSEIVLGAMPTPTANRPTTLDSEPQKAVSPDEQAMIDWAKQNPDDPDAQTILSHHGVK